MARKGRRISEYTKGGKELWDRIILDTYGRLFAKSADGEGRPGDFMRLCAEGALVNDMCQSPDYDRRYHVDFGGLPLTDYEKYRIKRDIVKTLRGGFKIEIPFRDYEMTMADEHEVYKAIREEYNMTADDLRKLKVSCDMGCSPKLKDFNVEYGLSAELYNSKSNVTKRGKKQDMGGEREAGPAGEGRQEADGVEVP